MLFDLCLVMDICRRFWFAAAGDSKDADAGSKCRWGTLTFDVDVGESGKWIFLKKVPPPKVVPPLEVLARTEGKL